MSAARLHWQKGQAASGDGRTEEWVGVDQSGRPVARVVRIRGPLLKGWRLYRAVALDDEARLIELRPSPPDGVGWLATIGGKVVGRAALPLQAVRTVEAALAVGSAP